MNRDVTWLLSFKETLHSNASTLNPRFCGTSIITVVRSSMSAQQRQIQREVNTELTDLGIWGYIFIDNVLTLSKLPFHKNAYTGNVP